MFPIGLASAAVTLIAASTAYDLAVKGDGPTCVAHDRPAKVVRSALFDYPATIPFDGESRMVEVRVAISATGEVESAGVYKSSGFDGFDRAAVSAATSNTYAPEIRRCEAVRGSYLVEVVFSADS